MIFILVRKKTAVKTFSYFSSITKTAITHCYNITSEWNFCITFQISEMIRNVFRNRSNMQDRAFCENSIQLIVNASDDKQYTVKHDDQGILKLCV